MKDARSERYAMAVDDLDRWCGHEFQEARLIAAHLKAHGEGHSLNAGTPHADEPCTISGLREQLRRLKRATPPTIDSGCKGEVVAYRYRYFDANEGFGLWKPCSKDEADYYRKHYADRYEVEALCRCDAPKEAEADNKEEK